eukprot:767091-Hanusia_phi.AAC.8
MPKRMLQLRGGVADELEEAEYCSDCSRIQLPWDVPEAEEPEPGDEEEELKEYMNDPNRTKHYFDYMFGTEPMLPPLIC